MLLSECLAKMSRASERRQIEMTIQVFADESEGAPPGVRNHFVMAGLGVGTH